MKSDKLKELLARNQLTSMKVQTATNAELEEALLEMAENQADLEAAIVELAEVLEGGEL